MKKILSLIWLLSTVAIFFTNCKKYDQLDTFGNGKPVVLTSSASDVAPPASDSDNVVLKLNWTNPEYATDPASYKFIIEIAEAGSNFANASQTTVSGVYSHEFTGRALNTILSGFGYHFDEPHDMEIRIVSSYANNNERYISNIVPAKMTAYKGPSTVIDATTMFVIGDAAKGWDTDVALNLIGVRKFAGVVELAYGKEFKLRKDAGSWDVNWGLADTATFAFNRPINLKLGGGNLKLPDGTGTDLFQIIMDVDANTVTISKVASTMNIIGDAALGWDTDLPMNNDGNGKFSVITNLLGTKEMKFRAIPGSWDVNWGIASGDTLTLGQAFAIQRDGPNIKIPADGKYKVAIDLGTLTATITASNFPDNLFLVGGGTPAGWDPAASFPFRKLEDGKFEVYSPITANGEFKFLQTQSWDGDWGDNKTTTGVLEQNDEQNCKVTDEGFYKINCDFTTGKWTALKTSWGLIGSATPGGWDSDTDMTKASDFGWTITLDLIAGEIKFRANDGWDINFGDNGADGSLEGGGANIAIAEAGNYTITMELAPTGYTYTVKKN